MGGKEVGECCSQARQAGEEGGEEGAHIVDVSTWSTSHSPPHMVHLTWSTSTRSTRCGKNSIMASGGKKRCGPAQLLFSYSALFFGGVPLSNHAVSRANM